mmetsp:Transcript_18055/g.48572  ORF Transcript_18055/g.48572 Transcript_18055/m.48572 type:complete len:81 (+) Transcript_18055:485-727(+)
MTHGKSEVMSSSLLAPRTTLRRAGSAVAAPGRSDALECDTKPMHLPHQNKSVDTLLRPRVTHHGPHAHTSVSARGKLRVP